MPSFVAGQFETADWTASPMCDCYGPNGPHFDLFSFWAGFFTLPGLLIADWIIADAFTYAVQRQ